MVTVSRLTAIFCVFILLVCLAMCVTSLTSLRNAVEETSAYQREASALTEKLSACMEKLPDGSGAVPVSAEPEKDDTETYGTGYRLCASGGRIALYSADGYLLRMVEKSPSDFPPADRAALEKGIDVPDARTLSSLLADYGIEP